MGRKIFIPLFMFGMLITDGYAVCSDHDANIDDCWALQSDTTRLNYLGYKTHEDIFQEKNH